MAAVTDLEFQDAVWPCTQVIGVDQQPHTVCTGRDFQAASHRLLSSLPWNISVPFIFYFVVNVLAFVAIIVVCRRH